jgi:hypothetical protein
MAQPNQEQDPEALVRLCTVTTEIEGQILTDLLNSGGIEAMFHSAGLSGYGLINAAGFGGAGEVLVRARHLDEARNFVKMWQTPLLDEADDEQG